MGSPAPTISVVIPLYGEGEHLGEVVAAVRRELEAAGEAWEIVLVDDGSADGTWAAIRRESERTPGVRGVRLSRNFGKEAAVCAGLDAARGEAVIVMDGDLQHPPELLGRMIELWRAGGADVVEGVKTRHRRQSAFSRVCSRPFYWAMRKLSGFDFASASDYKLLSRPVRDAWLKLGERNLFFRGMVAWLGFRVERVPFEVAPRVGGRTRWTAPRLMKLALTGMTAYSAAPLRLASVLGAVFFVFAVAFGIYALVMKLAGRALTGFTTVILLQLIIGSLVLIVLGIIGEYVARIYEEVKGRPRYIVAETLEPSRPRGGSPGDEQ